MCLKRIYAIDKETKKVKIKKFALELQKEKNDFFVAFPLHLIIFVWLIDHLLDWNGINGKVFNSERYFINKQFLPLLNPSESCTISICFNSFFVSFFYERERT